MREDWKFTPIGEVSTIVNGGTPKSGTAEYWDGDILWITPKDMGKLQSIYVSETSRKISQAGLAKSSAKLIPENSVILSTRAPIGHLAINQAPMATNQGCRGLVPKSRLETKFLFYFLKLNVQLLNELGTGTTFRELSKGALAGVPIPLPSVPEQKRIVAILDDAFERIDAAVANAMKNLTNTQELYQGVIQSSIEGKFTSNSMDDWPAEDQFEKPGGKLLPLIEETEIPFNMPKSWRWCRLGSIVDFLNGDRGKNYPNKSEYAPSGLPWINTGHIQADGSLSSETMNYITRAKFDTLGGGRIEAGDLVYCLRGATIGKTAFVDPYTEGSVASSLVIIRPGPCIHRKYLYYFLISRLGRELIKRFDNGAAQPNLAASSVAKYVTPLPPLSVQKVIIELLDTLAVETQRLEANYQQKLGNLAELKQSILQRAFSGELTAQEVAA